MKLTKTTIGFCMATAGFVALGYFGVQHFGRNTMFSIAAAVGSGGAIVHVLQKPSKPEAPASQPEPPIVPIKTTRKTKKSQA